MTGAVCSLLHPIFRVGALPGTRSSRRWTRRMVGAAARGDVARSIPAAVCTKTARSAAELESTVPM